MLQGTRLTAPPQVRERSTWYNALAPSALATPRGDAHATALAACLRVLWQAIPRLEGICLFCFPPLVLRQLTRSEDVPSLANADRMLSICTLSRSGQALDVPGRSRASSSFSAISKHGDTAWHARTDSPPNAMSLSERILVTLDSEDLFDENIIPCWALFLSFKSEITPAPGYQYKKSFRIESDFIGVHNPVPGGERRWLTPRTQSARMRR